MLPAWVALGRQGAFPAGRSCPCPLTCLHLVQSACYAPDAAKDMPDAPSYGCWLCMSSFSPIQQHADPAVWAQPVHAVSALVVLHCSPRGWPAPRAFKGQSTCQGLCPASSEEAEGARRRLHEILQAYKGTHNFHNFTAGVSAKEAAAKRYMQSLTCDAVLHLQVCGI